MSAANQVLVPPTTDTTIVFPLNIFAKGYDATFYSPSLTHNRASLEEITEVLNKIQEIKKPSRKVVIALWLYIFALIGIIALMIVGIISSVGNHYCPSYGSCYDTDNTGLLVGSIIGGIIGIMAIIFIFIVYIVRVAKQTKVQVQNFLNTVNPDFNNRGLRWHLPIHFPRWVELCKDYVNLEGPYGQGAYMPPQQYNPAAGYTMPEAQPQNYGYPSQQGHSGYPQPKVQQQYDQQTFNNYNQNQA